MPYESGEMLSADNVNEWIRHVNENPDQQRPEFGTNFWRWFGSMPTLSLGYYYYYYYYYQFANYRMPAIYVQGANQYDTGPQQNVYESPGIGFPYNDASGHHDQTISGREPTEQPAYYWWYNNHNMNHGAEPVMVSIVPGSQGEMPTDVTNDGTNWGSSGRSTNGEPRTMQYGYPGYRALGQWAELPKNEELEPGEKLEFGKFVRHPEWQQYQYFNNEWYSYSQYAGNPPNMPVGPTFIPTFQYLSKSVGTGISVYPGAIISPGIYEISQKVTGGRAIDLNPTNPHYRKKAEIQLVKVNYIKDGFTGSYIPNKIYPLSDAIPTYFTNDNGYWGYGFYYGMYQRGLTQFQYSGLMEENDVPGITIKWLDPPPTNIMELYYGLYSIRNVRQSAE